MSRTLTATNSSNSILSASMPFSLPIPTSLRGSYRCQGREDPLRIPEYKLADHIEDTPERKRLFSDTCKRKKSLQKVYVKNAKAIKAIQVSRHDSMDCSGEPLSDDVYNYAVEWRKFVRKPGNDNICNATPPPILIDNITPEFQIRPPTTWNFEVATSKHLTQEELFDINYNLLTPCSTRRPELPLPNRAQTAPPKASPKVERKGHWWNHLRRRSAPAETKSKRS